LEIGGGIMSNEIEEEVVEPKKDKEEGIINSGNIVLIIKRLSTLAALLYVLEFIGKMIINSKNQSQIMNILTALPSTVFNIVYCFVFWGIAYIIDYIRKKNEKN
jgi:hypothetical protein